MFWILLLASCTPAPPLPHHTLVFGGDVILGRRLNLALRTAEDRARVFEGIAPQLRAADIALVNAEGVVSGGGTYTDKGEPRPFTFRARPEALDLLADAGVDWLNVGNNHSGDYGPLALREMLDRTLLLGMDYTGGGQDTADAHTPTYRMVGDTVVAVIGADLTRPYRYAATDTQAGSLWLPGMNKAREDDVVRELTALLHQARAHAQLVLLTPHWGKNNVDAPSPLSRRLARRLIRAGYDGILGHSAHRLQGAELIDGKPVLYDAGNLLNDFAARPPHNGTMLFELGFSRAGFTEVIGHPVQLKSNATTLASPAVTQRTLQRFERLSNELGTSLTIADGVARIRCSPGGQRGPTGTPVPPRRRPPQAARLAPPELILDALPPQATPLSARWDNGIELVGYELLVDKLRIPKAAQIVTLYWRSQRPQTSSYMIKLRASGRTTAGKPQRAQHDHLPGDWLLPTNEWPVGKIIRDTQLFRLNIEPSGTMRFRVGLANDGETLPPVSSDRPPERGLIPLGDAVYDPDAIGLFDAWRQRHATQ